MPVEGMAELFSLGEEDWGVWEVWRNRERLERVERGRRIMNGTWRNFHSVSNFIFEPNFHFSFGFSDVFE